MKEAWTVDIYFQQISRRLYTRGKDQVSTICIMNYGVQVRVLAFYHFGFELAGEANWF